MNGILLAVDMVQNLSVPACIQILADRRHIRPLFAYTVLVFHAPTSGLYPFVIVCKGCHRNIPAPVEAIPDSWIIAACPLCGEHRRYLPNDIFQGRLSHELLAKSRRTGGWEWAR